MAVYFSEATISVVTLCKLEGEICKTTEVSTNHPDVVSKLKSLALDSDSSIGFGDSRSRKNPRQAAYIDLADAVILADK